MSKYQNGKIYTIRSFQTDMFYIGSTTQPLSKRFNDHRQALKSFNNGNPRYSTSYEIMKYDDCHIELLEECKFDNKEQLCRREGELIRLHKSKCVNIAIPCRTSKEYKKDNKEQVDEKVKQYYENNKDQINKYKKQWYESNKKVILQKASQVIHCQCGASMRLGSKTKHERTKKHQTFINATN